MMGDTWTPREGAYGRTRVGPIEAIRPNTGYHSDWKWRVDLRPFWNVEGRTYDMGDSPSPNDLVAEWTDSPVRTVTRREIVPGAYGLVVVHETFKPAVLTHITMNAHDPSPDELDAAARVLTQLAEALRRG